MKWLKDDGSLNIEALDALSENLKAVTDSNAAIDKVIREARIGMPTVVAFRCSHSGMFFPADYVKQWGRLYGVGQGDSPVSESLDSQYHVDPGQVKGALSIEQLMHPVAMSGAQIDYLVVPEEEFKSKALIPHHRDPLLQKRTRIMYQNQLKNPASQLRLLVAQFNAAAEKEII